jgi:hypothetical protein
MTFSENRYPLFRITRASGLTDSVGKKSLPRKRHDGRLMGDTNQRRTCCSAIVPSCSVAPPQPCSPKGAGPFFAASNRRRSVCEWESGGLRQTPAAYFFRRKLHCATVPWLGLASKLRAVLLSHRFTVSAVRPTSSKISTTSSLGTTTSPDALRRKLARACTHKLVASHATVGPLNIWALILLASSATAFS